MIFGTVVAVVGILLSSSALSDEKKMANAARLFDEKRASFQEIADLMAAHDEFQSVARVFPIEREALIGKNRPFDNESRTAYSAVLVKLKKLGLDAVSLFKAPAFHESNFKHGDLESVRFYVSSRGLASQTVLTTIVRWRGDIKPEELMPPKSYCRPLSLETWFVCHVE